MMPRFAIDDAEKLSVRPPLGAPTTSVSVGLQALKRGRPLEPRPSPLPCTQKCCVRSKENSASLPVDSYCCSRVPALDVSDFGGVELPEDEFDEFDLGPPPPSGPVLVRQHAVDVTAAAEAKFANARARDAKAAVVMQTRAPSSVVPPSMFLRQAMWRDM